MSPLYLVTATILSTLFITSRACNYVGMAEFRYEETNDHSNSKNPTPIGFCVTDKKNASFAESKIFLCTPWNEPVLFRFSTADCTGSKPAIYGYVSGEYECQSSTACNVFNVQTSPKTGATCEANTETYGQFITLAENCWVEQQDDGYVSILATCDSATNAVEYSMYRGVLDCSGDPNITIATHTGECTLIPDDDNLTESYFELLNCGEVSLGSTPACSYVANATYNETYIHNGNTHTKQQSNDVVTPMGFDVCTNEFKNDTGTYSSQLFFCSAALQMGWVAQWINRSAPTQCNTQPDNVIHIESFSEFACNPQNIPCPHLFMRMSDFEDSNGTAACEFSDEYGEMRVATDKCWETKDGAAKAQCDGGGSLTYIGYSSLTDCQSDTNPQSIAMNSDSCYDFEDDFGTEKTGQPGNFSFFQAVSCNGVQISSNPKPDCMFVENPRYTNERGDDKDDKGVRVPIGVCQSESSDSDDESKMYICPPWGGVAVVLWDNLNCKVGGGSIKHVTDVSYSDENCDSENYCDYLHLRGNQVDDPVDGCVQNLTNWGEKVFVTGCANDYEPGKLKSLKLECTFDSLTYSLYEGALDCAGTPIEISVTDQAQCADFGDPMFIDVLHCGAFVEDPSSDCSYIMNPIYNSSELGYEERDGAFPFSTELCLTQYDGEHAMSNMYICEPESELAFIAIWNNSASCDGEPDYIERVWSALDEMVCGSLDVEDCKYTVVRTSESPGESCRVGTRIEESARLIQKCWPDRRNNGTNDMSWEADCAGDIVTVSIYSSATCDGIADKTIVVGDNECTTEMDNDGEQTFFDVVYCTEPAAPTTAPTSPSAAPTTLAPTTSTESPQGGKGCMLKTVVSVVLIIFILVIY